MSDSAPDYPALTMLWKNYRGLEVKRKVNQRIDIREFLGTAVYPWLAMAANPHLSAADIERWLGAIDLEYPGAARQDHWIQRRRWMVDKGDTRRNGADRNQDGQQDRAVLIMAANENLSLRDLVRLLGESGISRSREWVRRHRCDSLTT